MPKPVSRILVIEDDPPVLREFVKCLTAAARPMTGLAAMIAESARRNAGRSPESFSGEWMILRYFYWVN